MPKLSLKLTAAERANLAKAGKAGGDARAKKLPKWKRSQIAHEAAMSIPAAKRVERAKKAIRVRWEKVRAR